MCSAAPCPALLNGLPLQPLLTCVLGQHLCQHTAMAALQELGQKQEWVSELIFGSLFSSFMVWSFSPFVTEKKRFYTCVLFARLLMVLVGQPIQPVLAVLLSWPALPAAAEMQTCCSVHLPAVESAADAACPLPGFSDCLPAASPACVGAAQAFMLLSLLSSRSS